MALMIGVILALAVGLMTTAVGMDRDRALYPTVTIVVASLYALFAVMGATPSILMIEVLVGSVYLALALWGFRSSLWIVAVALAGHGTLDLFHGRLISNPGVPTWWPAFCGMYDLTAAAFLAWLIRSGRVSATR